MFGRKHHWSLWILLFLIAFITSSCRLFSGSGFTNTTNPTQTPTVTGGAFMPGQNPCEGISGKLEMQLLVGPSEAVGLEPYTFAEIPFQVVKEGDSYRITAAGPVDYYEDVLDRGLGVVLGTI